MPEDTNIMHSIFTDVLAVVKPTQQEIVNIQIVAKDIISLVDKTAEDLQIEARGELVGSAARGTWLSGAHDLDIFITFPESTTSEELEANGISIARKVAQGCEMEERYAQHPYIHMRYAGYEVDLVPCFKVKSASQIKSAVDRTPFHNRFIKEHINGMEDEVLLLKQFMKGCGAYGSELKNQGFAGYLVELLVIHYGSFTDVLKAVSRWHHPVVIEDFVVYADDGCARNRGFDEPLIVIDPTDPNRNVAAAVSLTRMYEFVDAARSFIQNPDYEYFFPKPVPAKTPAELKDIRHIRGSHLCALVLDLPDMVDDVLYPQLRKTEQSIVALLQRNDFSIIGSDVHLGESFVNSAANSAISFAISSATNSAANSNHCGENEADCDTIGIDWNRLRKATVVFELLCSEIAGVERRMGPPVHVGMNAASFKDKHRDDPKDLSCVYIEGDRFMVDVVRQYTTAQALIEGNIHGISTGKHARVGLKRSFEILCDDELINGATEDMCAVLTRLYLKTR